MWSTRGVLTPRFFAYLIDLCVIGFLIVVLGMIISILGVLTFGLAWLLFPALAATGVIYSAVTVGGPRQATIGMRLLGLKVISSDGRPDVITAGVHALFYYVAAGTGVLWLIDIVTGLLRSDRRLLHDVLTGLTVVRD
jgi:uncharacterized RDD family membrane protein YckC